MQMLGNDRTISFTPTPEYFAKGCYGIEGTRKIPPVGPNDKNDFLTRLFDEARNNIAHENDAFAPLKAQYDATMAKAKEIIDSIKTPEEATEAANTIPSLEHALTSKKESSAMLSAKAKELGYTWDKENKTYSVPADPNAPQTQETA